MFIGYLYSFSREEYVLLFVHFPVVEGKTECHSYSSM